MKKLLIASLILVLAMHLNAQEYPAPETGTTALALVEGQPQNIVSREPEALPLHALKGRKPAFPGGEAAMLRFINKQLKYPELAISHSYEGTVVVEFVVDREGRVGQTKILKGIGMLCDEAALAVFEEMPRWQPALQAGNTVAVKCVAPVKFHLY